MIQKLLFTFLLFCFITIGFSQVANQPNSYEVCDGDGDGFALFDLETLTPQILGSQSSTDFTVTYHLTQSNADNGFNAIASPFSNIMQNNQVIYIRVEENSSGNYDTTFAYLGVNTININLPTALEVCDELASDYSNNDDGIATFDLTSKNDEITGGNTNLLVSYYLTQTEADNEVNQITNTSSFTNIVNPLTIFVRVEDITTGCHGLTTLELRVLPNPSPSPNPSDIVVCDNNSNGFATFDLTLNEAYIINGEPGVSLAYFNTLNDAINNSNPIANPSNYINVIDPQVIYVRVTNDTSGCFTLVDFDLVVDNCGNGVINVKAYNDTNNSGDFDSGETNYIQGYFTYEKNNDGIVNQISSSTGEFNIYPDNASDSYTINYYLDNSTCLILPISTYNNITTSSSNTTNVFFALQETSSNCSSDIGVVLYGYTAPRPGQPQVLGLEITNYNGTTVSGSVDFVIDSQVTLNNVTSLENVTNTATGFTLDFTGLAQGDSSLSYVFIDVPMSMNIGDVLTHTVNYSTTDYNANNNTFTLISDVVNSYDPNDITESHGGNIVFDGFTSTDEFLYYTIRFQNLGTAEAIDIKVDNTLSSLLDTSTFKMVSSSHNYVVNKLNNQLTFTMNGINLPAQVQNDLGSNGFLVYKIKPLAGYAVGTIIPNTAEIYFDFNPAVITNTFNTEFVQSALTVNEFYELNYTIYPNPVKNELFISSAVKTNLSIELYNVLGEQVLVHTNSDLRNTLKLKVSHLNSGIYFLKISDEFSSQLKKIVIE